VKEVTMSLTRKTGIVLASVERARIESRLRGILTDDQQNRLESMRRQFEERLERRVGLARTIWKEHAADFVDAL